METDVASSDRTVANIYVWRSSIEQVLREPVWHRIQKLSGKQTFNGKKICRMSETASLYGAKLDGTEIRERP